MLKGGAYIWSYWGEKKSIRWKKKSHRETLKGNEKNCNGVPSSSLLAAAGKNKKRKKSGKGEGGRRRISQKDAVTRLRKFEK